MGNYTVWVVGPCQFDIIEDYHESNNVSAAFPGLTFDYIAYVEEPGPANLFATLPDEEFPFAIVTPGGQIVHAPHPGSEPDPSVAVGTDQMRRFLERNPNEIITPMAWHT